MKFTRYNTPLYGIYTMPTFTLQFIVFNYEERHFTKKNKNLIGSDSIQKIMRFYKQEVYKVLCNGSNLLNCL